MKTVKGISVKESSRYGAHAWLAISYLFLSMTIMAQEKSETLFNDSAPLDIALTISVRAIKKTKGDTSYIGHRLYYRNAAGLMDSVHAGLRARGNSRMDICYFPPLWIKMGKSQAKGTLFEGNRKLKLVLPCLNRSESNDLILREYLCYKLYEVVSNYAFKTRLVNVDLTEVLRNKRKTYQQKGILIEDVKKTAERFDAKPLNDTRINVTALRDTMALRFDLFQYMIANTDWSQNLQHNSKLIYRQQTVIAIPYDFDMSGLVNASYAVVSQVNGEQLPIQSVTDRFYKGYCQPEGVTEFVRKEFVSNEQTFMSVPDEVNGQLTEKEIDDVKSYLSEFFVILKDDDLFRNRILLKCQSLH